MRPTGGAPTSLRGGVGSGPRRGVPDGPTGAVLVLPGVVAAAAPLAGLALPALALLVVGGAACLGRGWRRLPQNLPAALTLVTVGLVAVAQLASVLGWRLFASPVTVRVLLAVAGLALAATGLVLSRAVAGGEAEPRLGTTPGTTPAPEPVAGRWAFVPGGVLAAYGLVFQLLPTGRRVEWFLGGDNIRHLWLAAEEGWRGNLEYVVQSSPRAWHTVLVTAWSAEGGTIDGPGLRSLVSVMSTGVWFAFAVLAVAVGVAADLVARRLGLGPRGRAFAGVLAGSATLWPTFFGNYMVLGFETAIFCAALLAAAVVELLQRAGSRTAVVVTAAAGVLVAHTWQLVLPAAALSVGAAGWSHVRPDLRSRRRWGLLAVTYGVGLLLAWPSLFAVTERIGFDRASIQGVPAPALSGWLPFTLAGVVAVLVLRRRDPVLPVVGLMSLGTTFLAVLVALRAGVPVTHYYPRKMLWQSCLLGLPLAVAVSVLAASRLRARVGAGAPLRVLGGAGLVGAVALSLVFPAMAVAGPWSHVDGDTVLDAAAAPQAAEARVVWLGGSPIQDTVTRVLLDFYRVSTPLDRTIQYPAPVGEECELFADHVPTVLSPHSPAEVAARYSCVTAPVVVRP